MKIHLFQKFGTKVAQWARSQSQSAYLLSLSCCGEEAVHSQFCRYDLERFGISIENEPEKSDLLIFQGPLTYALTHELLAILARMPQPHYVMAIGSCACTGGPYSADKSYTVVQGLSNVIPVDIRIPGCPPRPEAILQGVIELQGRIREGNFKLPTGLG
jgi:NADH-quinone oxidoreductase subunit B